MEFSKREKELCRAALIKWIKYGFDDEPVHGEVVSAKDVISVATLSERFRLEIEDQ